MRERPTGDAVKFSHQRMGTATVCIMCSRSRRVGCHALLWGPQLHQQYCCCCCCSRRCHAPRCPAGQPRRLSAGAVVRRRPVRQLQAEVVPQRAGAGLDGRTLDRALQPAAASGRGRRAGALGAAAAHAPGAHCGAGPVQQARVPAQGAGAH